MRHPEYQYLDLLEHVLTKGDERIDRTKVGTRSIFGAMLRFDLSDGNAPILTTKRVYWKTAVKEMLWFLTGGTNIRPLLKENVRIWTDWPLARYRRASGDNIEQQDFEQRVLEAVGKLGEARALTIQAEIGERASSVGAIVEAIRSLELLGLIYCWQGNAFGERAEHHPIKWCAVTEVGEKVEA